jgi:hypothetical protein
MHPMTLSQYWVLNTSQSWRFKANYVIPRLPQYHIVQIRLHPR